MRWLFAIVLAAAGVAADAATPERRVALVIGNADYAMAPLRNPVNHARAMAPALRGHPGGVFRPRPPEAP